MPELITINYLTDLIHFFMYLTIIYYMLYNVVWVKLRTFYFVNLSRTLTRKKVTLNYLYFTINYLYSIFSTTINNNILLLINILTLQQRTIIYDKQHNTHIEKNISNAINLFYIQNPYFESINMGIFSKIEANKSLKAIY